MGPTGIEPEHCRTAGGPSSAHRQLHPVGDWDVLGLAHPVDVTDGHRDLEDDPVRSIGDPDGPGGGDLEGLVVAAVLLRRLSHEADIGHRTHGGRVECSVSSAVVDGHLIDPGVARVRDHGEGVGLLTIGPPHVPGGTDHRRH